MWGMYPIVLGMTCLEGSFHSTNLDAMAEYIVRATDKGAVASWSATGLGVATGHDLLHRGFYRALFEDGVARIGPAVLAGKLRLYQSGMNWDLVHTFTLFGDPALDTGIQAICVNPQADVTQDGIVDVNDVMALVQYWRAYKGKPHDQDGNLFIDIRDFAIVAQAFGPTCQAR